jgi:transcriptional regulator GlxA family with amidase domain
MSTIGIIVFDGVLTSEVIGPAEVFAIAVQRGYLSGSVLLIGVESQPTIRTAEGITMAVDRTLEDAPTLDVLIVPGGDDVSHLQAHAGLNTFIQRHQESAEWIGSVCAGAFILGSAGVLDGRQATTWRGGESDLQQQFPQVNVIVDSPVVIDDRRMTANGGLVSYRAALIMLARLTSAECAQNVYRSLNMDRIGDWESITESI